MYNPFFPGTAVALIGQISDQNKFVWTGFNNFDARVDKEKRHELDHNWIS